MSDFDNDLALEILRQIQQSIQKILKRFEPIHTTEDFSNSEAGLEKLDAICMQLITIGESLKNLDKVTNGSANKWLMFILWIIISPVAMVLIQFELNKLA